MKYLATLEQEIILEIKDNNKFLENLKDYRESINSTGDEKDVLKHIAYNVITNGSNSLIEGVGYVGYGSRQPLEDWCGVNVMHEDSNDIELEELEPENT